MQTPDLANRTASGPATAAPITILVDSRSHRPYAGYLAEMLRIEGLNWLAVRDLASQPLVPGEPLGPCVVATAAVGDSAAPALAAYVRSGGRLLAARPSQSLAIALALAPPVPIWRESLWRYVLLEPQCAAIANLPWVPGGVQCFGEVGAYLPAEATSTTGTTHEVAAWLAPFPGQRTRFPAALCIRHGSGRAAVFAFDPAASAVRQQQGTPEQASTGILPDFDGDGSFRGTELFLGQLDPALRDVPQADLQRTLLLRLLEWLTEDAPLPRLWRFPGGAQAMALFDGDSDSMSIEDFRLAISTCDRYDAPFTTFLKPEHVELLSASEEAAARIRGHGFGPHPWSSPRPTVEAMRAALEENCALFAGKYGYRPRVHRGHWVIWPGWVDHARSLASAGIRLDTNFTAGRSFKGGYPNGSGLPLRFVDGDATLLDIYEASTISTDDGWLSSKNDLAALTIAEAISRSCQQIDDALERYHTVVHPYFHPVSLKGGRALPYPTLPWLESMLAHCRRRGVPFLRSEQWVEWNDARRGVTLSACRYAPQTLTLTLTASEAVEHLTLLVPLPAGCTSADVHVDGESIEGEAVVLRHGKSYASATLSLRAADSRRLTVRWE